MKFLIAFVALFALALAAPPRSPSGDAQIVALNADVGPESFKYKWVDGNYLKTKAHLANSQSSFLFSYETSDGQKAESDGQLKNIGTEQEALAVKGSFSYVGDDGVTYSVNYVADENGFQPQGAHLPVA